MIRPSSDPAEERLWKRVTITVQRTTGAASQQSGDTSSVIQAIDLIEIFERRDFPRFVRLIPREGVRATALSMLRALYPSVRWEFGAEEPADDGKLDIEVRYPEPAPE
jgi:hypothetical protein